MRKAALMVALAASIAAIVATAQAAPRQGAHGAEPAVANPGFEVDGAAVANPSGWRELGARSASYVEAGGHLGSFQLTHYSAKPFAVTTTQTVSGLSPGPYTLGVWVRSSIGRNSSTISLFCGGPPATTQLPALADSWLHVVVTADVHSRSCTISLGSVAAGGEWANFDDVTLTPTDARLSVLGADVSSLKKSEDKGGVYRDEFGRRGDALRILRNHGLNWIRLRVWVNPADGYHNTAELLAMARRAKALGIKVLVDLHYSDFWADPGKQWTPVAWQGETFPQLLQTFKLYTNGLVRKLVAQGTPPAMVQIGNETNAGLLWDYGATWTGCSTADDGTGHNVTVCHTENWDQLATLLTAGYNAVKSASPSTKVMLHIANGGDNGGFHWWFDNVTTRNVPFDVIGVSYYPYWHGSLAALQYNLDDVARTYGKDIVLAETAYPFTTEDKDGWPNSVPNDGSPLTAGYDATPAGQAAMFRDVLSIVRAVPDGHGLGAFYWDATWTGVPGNGWSPVDPSQGNAWENQALWNYDNLPLPAMNDFQP